VTNQERRRCRSEAAAAWTGDLSRSLVGLMIALASAKVEVPGVAAARA
jgi:hypothetical protein